MVKKSRWKILQAGSCAADSIFGSMDISGQWLGCISYVVRWQIWTNSIMIQKKLYVIIMYSFQCWHNSADCYLSGWVGSHGLLFYFAVVVPLREHLNANIQSWNPQLSVFANLENLLGQKFPSPSTTKKEDFSMECGICYAYRLNDLIPDKVCDDSRCGQSFHSLCLYEWLRDLPSTRQSFNMVFGECPYCSKPITVKMVTGKWFIGDGYPQCKTCGTLSLFSFPFCFHRVLHQLKWCLTTDE